MRFLAILHDTIEAIIASINVAEQPVIMAGGGIIQYNLVHALEIFAEKTNIPIVSSILGKSAIEERNSHYLGVYAGIVGDDDIRRYVESSDCLILLGFLLTDVDMGANTAVMNPDVLITLSEDCCHIGRQSFPGPGLMFLPEIIQRKLTVHETSGRPAPVRDKMAAFIPGDARVTTESLVLALNSVIDEKTVLITEVGDAVMMSLDITIKRPGGFINPAYYSSIGFSVPAGIGVQAAYPDLRPLVLSGDGAFQMTGMEISTAGRYHMNPIVIVLNNSGF